MLGGIEVIGAEVAGGADALVLSLVASDLARDDATRVRTGARSTIASCFRSTRSAIFFGAGVFSAGIGESRADGGGATVPPDSW